MEKATVLFGPPGTGKTTRLIREIKSRINDGIAPHRICVVSYTKAAAKEIATRAGAGGAGGVRAQTQHSLSYQLAGVIADQVMGKAWANEFKKVSGLELTFSKGEELEELSEADRYMALYAYGRSTMNRDWHAIFRDSGAEGSLQRFLYFVETYESFKSAYGVIDFSDMLDAAYGLNPDCDVLILDEAQDFSRQQWRLIESWMPFVNEVIVAGDDDQAIYKWSGADPRGMADFARATKAKQIVLDQSYRIPLAVHTLANHIISHVEDRVEKVYRPREEMGSVDKYGSCSMLRFDPEEDTFILVRNHALRTEVEHALMSKGVPYLVEGGRPGPFSNFYIRAIKSWIKATEQYKSFGTAHLSDNELNNIKRCAQNLYKSKLNDPEALIDQGITWERLIYVPRELSTYYRSIWAKYGTFDVPTKIRISTIHNSKGREADHVVLINGMTDRTAEALLKDPDSELRTFYVGVTRARKRLSIVSERNPLRELI